MTAGRVAVVSPVFGNAATLVALAQRVLALGPHVVLRLVIDASPDDSATVAEGLTDPRVRVTVLRHNVGQHAALARGLADEPDAVAWVCLDADLQDPPEAVPSLLAALGPVAAVFAGRRGDYESRGRRLTGEVHRRAVRALTGLPIDAGAFVALDARGRAAVLDGVHVRRAPSVVAALAGLPVASVPVARHTRDVGASAWTSRARLRQSVRTLGWLAGQRLRGGPTAARADRS